MAILSAVDCGTLHIIPSDNRNEFDLNDSSVGDSMELCDLSALVPRGTKAVMGYMEIRTANTVDRTMLLVRGYGQATGDSSGPSDYEKIVTLRLEAEIGDTSIILFGGHVVIYAPDGKFEYQRYNSTHPVDTINFTLWGYYL